MYETEGAVIRELAILSTKVEHLGGRMDTFISAHDSKYSDLETRVRGLESFQWKLAGGLLALVALVEAAAKLVWGR